MLLLYVHNLSKVQSKLIPIPEIFELSFLHKFRTQCVRHTMHFIINKQQQACWGNLNGTAILLSPLLMEMRHVSGRSCDQSSCKIFSGPSFVFEVNDEIVSMPPGQIRHTCNFSTKYTKYLSKLYIHNLSKFCGPYLQSLLQLMLGFWHTKLTTERKLTVSFLGHSG